MGYKVTIEHVDEGDPNVSCTVVSSNRCLGMSVTMAIERLHSTSQMSQIAHDLVLAMVADIPNNLECIAGEPGAAEEHRFTDSLLALARTFGDVRMRTEIKTAEEFLEKWMASPPPTDAP